MLTPQGGAIGDLFGASISIDGDRMLIGSWGADVDGSNSGAAYVFDKGPSGWVQAQKIAPNDGMADANFGKVVALDGNVGVVGAPGWGETATTVSQGAAYVLGVGEGNSNTCASSEVCASNMCTDGVCCPTVCSGSCYVCSMAAGGLKDGICSLAKPSTVCGPANGPCDIEETCTGTSQYCPTDLFQPDDMPCPGGLCQDGVCTNSVPDPDSGVDLGPQNDGTAPGLDPSTPAQDTTIQPDGPVLDAPQTPATDAAQTTTSDGGGCQITGYGATTVPLLVFFAFLLGFRRR